MDKVVHIAVKGQENRNILYWVSLSYQERMKDLELIRNSVNKRMYGTQSGFQRVFRVVE